MSAWLSELELKIFSKHDPSQNLKKKKKMEAPKLKNHIFELLNLHVYIIIIK